MMNKNETLLKEIDQRYYHKKIYDKKEIYYPNKKKFTMQKDDHYMIKLKVEEMCKDISKKYKMQESEVYEELYLKVRKLFLELM